MTTSTTAATKELISCTIGLMCTSYNDKKPAKLRKMFFFRLENGSVEIEPCSANNLQRSGTSRYISSEEFSNRPTDAYDDNVEARWAFNKSGYSIDNADNCE